MPHSLHFSKSHTPPTRAKRGGKQKKMVIDDRFSMVGRLLFVGWAWARARNDDEDDEFVAAALLYDTLCARGGETLFGEYTVPSLHSRQLQ